MIFSYVTDDIYRKIHLAFGQGLERSVWVHNENHCFAGGLDGV